MDNFILVVVSDTTKIIAKPSNNTSNLWFWLSILEFVIILFLIIKFKKKKTDLAFSDLKKDVIKNAGDKNIDMNNLMNSINGSRDLYKELSRKCHPDRFVNMPEQKVAEEIFQEISKNQRNFEKLTELKERAEKELNINF